MNNNDTNSLLRVEDLKTWFPAKNNSLLPTEKRFVKAVDGVSFELKQGETFGLVGESGCGKTTIGKTILRLEKATAGKVLFEGKDVFSLNRKELKDFRQKTQMVFQDPYSSLDPRMTVEQIIQENMVIHKAFNKEERIARTDKLLDDVGLAGFHARRYPPELSGGQRQRVCIARALSLHPKLVVCDEPVSALDVSIQSQVLNLLMDLKNSYGLSYLFIAHGMAVVKHISDRIGVMYLGKMMEISPKSELYAQPLHPYTQALLSSIPIPEPGLKRERIILEGDVPSPLNPPTGCRFHTRCKYARPECKECKPCLKEVAKDHFVACHLYDDAPEVKKTESEEANA